MKAAIVHSFERRPGVGDVPKPTPGTGEIVVRIEARLAAIIFSVRLALLGLIAACLV
jgi:NADPH:quinone reductase-like Zn-dependent oxidoreductase